MLAIRLMRTGAKKRPSYRIVVKEKQSKRDGAYLENLGTYNPTREPAEIKLKADRVQYWISKGAQPTDTVRRLIKAAAKAQAAVTESAAEAA
ncbi:MAG: 30S ribosomal protein S16 [Pyrinomonadaceae bacterium]